MIRFCSLLASVLSIGVAALWPAGAAAQEPPLIRVTTNAPVPLLVGGLETAGVPASVQAGSQVCIAAALHHASEAERWAFQRWSHGPTTECVTLAQPGVYRALYAHEVLLHVRSGAPGLQRSAWVPFGAPTDVQVPPEVAEGQRVRYRFQEWSDGDTPFQPSSRIAPLKPTSLEAKWAKEYLVRVEGPEGVEVPGSGWHPDGVSLVLQAPDTVPGESARERLKFARWETAGSPSVALPESEKPTAAVTVAVNAPYTFRAVYEKEFLAVVTNPGGTLLRKWSKAGEELVLETPPAIPIVPELTQLVFRRWEGQEGLVSPKITGVINAPVELRAVYDRQHMVTVVSKHAAAGTGWYTSGATASVSAPVAVTRWLVLQDRFAGFAGYPKGRATVQVLVQEPVTLTAIYDTGVDIGVLALLLLVPLAAVVLYIANRWVMLWVRGRGVGPRPARRTAGPPGQE